MLLLLLLLLLLLPRLRRVARPRGKTEATAWSSMRASCGGER
jgi:hypothetical protein